MNSVQILLCITESYQQLRGRSYDTIVLKVLAPMNKEIDDVKDRFCEELECVFDKFPRYHMNFLLGDFNAKVGMEDIFKQTIKNETL
jgi:hypothetical protein